MQLALILRKESLLRGVAELLVIVIGVLIALWADQWWAKRIDRHTEQEYLAALYDDTVATLKRLEQNFEQISRFRDAASSLSLTPIDGPYPPNVDVRRSLADLDASLANVEASQSDLMGVQSTVVDPFLARRTDLATVAKSGYAATDTGDLEDAGYASADSLIGPGIGTDHTGLMRDREFRGALAFRIVILSEQMESYVKLRAQLTRLRAQVESELDPR